MLTIDLERAHVHPGDRVLDLGCGGGRHAFACLRAGAQVVAADADEGEVAKALGMIDAMRDAGEIGDLAGSPLVADALALPVPDGSFDRIIASEILEHLLDDRSAIGELNRALRPGGSLAISVPRAGPEKLNWLLSREYHEVPGGHVRIYRRRDLIKRIEAVGLELVDSHHAHGLHAPYWWLRCAVGISKGNRGLLAHYHQFLVWDITKKPRSTRFVERILNPFIGKSLVLYFQKPNP